MPVPVCESNTAAASPAESAHSLDFAVEIVGTMPPPYGGVSIHCARLLEWLQARGMTARLWDLAEHEDESRRVFPYVPASLYETVKGTMPTVVHWHKLPDKRAMFDFARMWYGRTQGESQPAATVFSVHNSRLAAQVAMQPLGRRMAVRWFLRRCDAVVFDAVEGRDQGVALGCALDRCHVIPSFIPPVPDSERPETIPARLRDFIAAHQPVLSAVGWTIDFYDGVDIYGMDLLVEAMGRLVRTHPQIGLVFLLSHPSHPEYFAALIKRAQKLGIAGNIFWYTEPLESAVAIWNASDLFLRPTCTDGDAISIREALHLGIPVVASDAAVRPSRCRLFRNRDVPSLVSSITHALATTPESGLKDGRNDGERSPNHADDIIAVYRRALARRFRRDTGWL